MDIRGACVATGWCSIRSVIEAYSRQAKIEGMEQPHAAGLLFTNDNDIHLRVQSGNVVSNYRIDRWD